MSFNTALQLDLIDFILKYSVRMDRFFVSKGCPLAFGTCHYYSIELC
jgi:hypothetical protein